MGHGSPLQGSGPEVWVELELKAEGELKRFSHVELEINEGEKSLLAYARLQEARSGFRPHSHSFSG